MKSFTWSALVILLVAAVVWGAFDRSRKNDEIQAWIHQAALSDSLHLLAAGRYQRAAVELDNEKQLRATLKDSLPTLHRELQRIRAREHSYVSTIAELQDIVATGTGRDTIIVTAAGDSIHQVEFQYSQPGIRIDGWTRTPPPIYQLQVRHDPIPLHLVVSQLRDGSWRTNIETAPWVEISALDTRVVPRKPSWWMRNRHWITLGGGFLVGGWINKKR